VRAWIALVLCASAARGQEREPPNVLLILTDQMTRAAVACLGNEQVRTPSLDRLAAEGAVFTRSYCNTPLCGPSRHSLFTGRYASEIGAFANNVVPREGFRYLPQYLNDAGYFTGSVGKLHFIPRDDVHGFQDVYFHEGDIPGGRSHYHGWLIRELHARGIERYDYWRTSPGWYKRVEDLCQVNPLPPELRSSAWTTRKALRLMREGLDRDEPFFVHASYWPPHHPYKPGAEFLARYEDVDPELPASFYEAVSPMYAELREQDFKTILRHYYAFVTEVDDAIGRLLEGLDELGCADDTLVIMTSDHGDMLGSFRALGKGRPEERSLGVPLIVRHPRRFDGGRVVDVPVSLIDLLPTVLATVGEPVPADLPGRDLLPLIRGEATGPDPPVYALDVRHAPFLMLAVVDGPWKLSRTPAGDRLVHLEDDADELVDRTGEADAEPRARLTALLDAFWREQRAHVPDEIPAPAPLENQALEQKD